MADHRAEFAKALTDIDSLIEVPDQIRTFAIESLETLSKDTLKNTDKIKLSNAIEAIKNLKAESLRKNYQIIYNQLCILGVSALAATIERYFINYTNSNLDLLNKKKLEEIKITLADLAEMSFAPKSSMGTLILEKDKSINFQDLQSTLRSFETYFSKSFLLDEETEKSVIFFQQCRHILVHKGGKVDADFIRRVELRRANIKSLVIGESVQLFIDDWINLKKSFTLLVEAIIPNK